MSQTRNTIVTAMLTAVLTTILTYFTVDLLRRRPWKSQTALVEVPAVVGMRRAEAELVLQQRGLRLVVVEKRPNGVFPKGAVARQAPVRGERIPKGSIVAVVLSAGEDKVAVPAVVGKTLAEATTALAAAGLAVGAVEDKPHASVPKGRIVETSPLPGVKVQRATKVKLVVSAGPETGEVPRVVGRYYRSAKKKIIEAGFVVGKVHWADNEDYDEYQVLRQDPKAGTKAPKGTAIDLVVNRAD